MRRPQSVRFHQAPQTLSRRVGAEVLATRPGADDTHELSGGASEVWTELRSPRTLPELVDRLASAHEINRKAIAGQVEECLDALVAFRIVEEMQDFDG